MCFNLHIEFSSSFSGTMTSPAPAVRWGLWHTMAISGAFLFGPGTGAVTTSEVTNIEVTFNFFRAHSSSGSEGAYGPWNFFDQVSILGNNDIAMPFFAWWVLGPGMDNAASPFLSRDDFLGPPLSAGDFLGMGRPFLWPFLDFGRLTSLYSRKPWIQWKLGLYCFFSKSSSIALMKEIFQ